MNSKQQVYFCVLTVLCAARLIFGEIVQTNDGKVEGTVMQTRYGRLFQAFLKIPFAEPPIGLLRFRAPIPIISPWSGVLNCTSYGQMCMQTHVYGEVSESEDCLHLNVFTRNVNQVAKPVILFLHGGGFQTGSAVEYGPEYLMERDIVLVTTSYRLGVFGFLALEVANAPGNAGLKDQVLALKWIQRNIKNFGGDPKKVTIAGLSAGGYSVTAHMISPMSQGLFHNVIAVSGALAWQKRLKTNNFEAVKILAGKLNCPTKNSHDMMKCLKEKPSLEIARNQADSFFHCPIMTWIPVLEKDFGQERFLNDEPNNLFRHGNFSKVNVMIGVTADEFISPVASILESSNLTKLLNERFDEIAPRCFFFEANNFLTETEIGRKLREFYLPLNPIDIRSFNSLNQFFADGVIGYGVHKFVHYVSKLVNVYYYKFTYVGRHSRFKYPEDKPYGVHHVDDIQYLFTAKFIGPMIQTADAENLIVERMTRIWEQFSTTGNPNNASVEYLREMNWPKHDQDREFYLDIGTHLVEKNGLFLERYSVWDKLESSSGNSLKCPKKIFVIICIVVFFIFK